MLTIKIEQDCKLALEEMGKAFSDDAIIMTMRDSKTLMGIGVMRIFEEYAVIDDIIIKDEFCDISLEYGMGKSLLNVIDLRGIKHVVSDNERLEKQLRALKFKPISELENDESIPNSVKNCRLYLNLDGYFLANC